MWGKVVFVLLIVSMIPNSIGEIPQNHAITTDLQIQLQLNTTTQDTISTDTQSYYFTLEYYTNVTIRIESVGNLSVFMPFINPDVQDRVYTNSKPYSLTRYFRSSTQGYLFVIYPEIGSAVREYTITLTGNLMKGQTNNKRSTAYHLKDQKAISGVWNFTSVYIDSWYNFTIATHGLYRFNLKSDFGQGPGFKIIYNGTETYSQYHSVTNITQTLLLEMDPGNYSLLIPGGKSWSGDPKVLDTYKVWYTSQYVLQSPSQVTLYDRIYGTVTNGTALDFSFSMPVAAIIYFTGVNPNVLITVFNTSMVQSVWNYGGHINEQENLMFVSAGEYTLRMRTLKNDYQEFTANIKRIEPDRLESENNTQDNPYALPVNDGLSALSLHVPNDRDWFSVSISVKGSIVFYSIYYHIAFKVFNAKGEEIAVIHDFATYHPNPIKFSGNPQTFVIEVYVPIGYLGFRSYNVAWEFTPNTTRYGSSTSSKGGYSFLQTFNIFVISLTIVMMFRKRIQEKRFNM